MWSGQKLSVPGGGGNPEQRRRWGDGTQSCLEILRPCVNSAPPKNICNASFQLHQRISVCFQHHCGLHEASKWSENQMRKAQTGAFSSQAALCSSQPPLILSTCTLPPFSFYSSRGMFSTRRLIPLLTAGQQVNLGSAPSAWMGGPPLMELRLGWGLPFCSVMISSASPRPAASGCLNLPPTARSCWLELVHFPTAQRVRAAADTHRDAEKLFGNAIRLMRASVRARKNKNIKGLEAQLGCYYKHTRSIPGIRGSAPEQLPVSLPSCLVRVVTE